MRRRPILSRARGAWHFDGWDRSDASVDQCRSGSRCAGAALRALAESLPFLPGTFDLVVTSLSLIDIPDIRSAITEMARVLKPGGTLLIANLNSFNTAGADGGWVRDEDGAVCDYPIDHYLTERTSSAMAVGLWTF